MTRELLATDELDAILHALPPELVQRVRGLDGLDGLLEIVMDLGRLPEARFAVREEILSELRRRMNNEPAAELEEAKRELRKIALMRLSGLVTA